MYWYMHTCMYELELRIKTQAYVLLLMHREWHAIHVSCMHVYVCMNWSSELRPRQMSCSPCTVSSIYKICHTCIMHVCICMYELELGIKTKAHVLLLMHREWHAIHVSCIHVCMNRNTEMHILFTWSCVCMYVRVYVWNTEMHILFTWSCVCMCVCMYVCMHVCMYEILKCIYCSPDHPTFFIILI